MHTDDFWDRAADITLGTAFAVGLLFGLAVVGWQTFGWLKTDQWTSFPFASALHMINIDMSSVYEPKSWLGVARAARWVLELPASFACPASLIVLAGTFKAFVSSGTAR